MTLESHLDLYSFIHLLICLFSASSFRSGSVGMPAEGPMIQRWKRDGLTPETLSGVREASESQGSPRHGEVAYGGHDATGRTF